MSDQPPKKKPTKKRTHLVAELSLAVAVLAILVGLFQTDIRNYLSRVFGSSDKIVIGARHFPEQIMLGEILAQMLENQGVNVQRSFGVNGEDLRKGLRKRSIDVSLEYTGAAYNLFFNKARKIGLEKREEEEFVYNYVKKGFERAKIYVSRPLMYHNDWAIFVRGHYAEKYNLKNISDAVAHAENWTAFFPPDFIEDQHSGSAPFIKKYQLKFRRQQKQDISKIYQSLDSGSADLIVGNSTDGEVDEFDIVRLSDDLNFFPPYQPIFVAQQKTLSRFPELKASIETLRNAISPTQIRRMNLQFTRLKNNKEGYQEYVQGWIAATGLLNGTAAE